MPILFQIPPESLQYFFRLHQMFQNISHQNVVKILFSPGDLHFLHIATQNFSHMGGKLSHLRNKLYPVCSGSWKQSSDMSHQSTATAPYIQDSHRLIWRFRNQSAQIRPGMQIIVYIKSPFFIDFLQVSAGSYMIPFWIFIKGLTTKMQDKAVFTKDILISCFQDPQSQVHIFIISRKKTFIQHSYLIKHRTFHQKRKSYQKQSVFIRITHGYISALTKSEHIRYIVSATHHHLSSCKIGYTSGRSIFISFIQPHSEPEQCIFRQHRIIVQ